MTNVEGTVTVSIATAIQSGLTVYDLESQKVGTVDDVDSATGWFTVSTSDFTNKQLYLPFSLITNIDPRDLFLSRTTEELKTTYSNPPPHSTMVEQEGDRTTAITSEPSGYDGSPIVVDTARIDELKNRISAGDHVYTTDLEDVGTIKEYDPGTGMMRVEKGVFAKHDLLVPVTLVDYVDPDAHEVYLAFSQADLQRMQNPESVDMVVVQARDKETE